MIPIVIEWAPAESNYIAATQAFVQNVPLTFSNPVGVQSIGPNGQQAFDGDPAYQNNLSLIFNNAATGVPDINLSSISSHVDLPPGQSRCVTITCTVSSILVTIDGTNQYGDEITSTIVTVANTAVATNVYFTRIDSITATNNSGASIKAGIGNAGYTSFPMLDVYNKNATYTISYTNISANTQVTPIFTTDPLIKFIDRVQTITSFSSSNYFSIDSDNPNLSINTSNGADVSQTPFVLNTNQCASVSFSGIPLTSLASFVTSAASPFTQTIIQQGGRF